MSTAAVNAVIVAVYFALTVWVGRRFAGPQGSLDDYLLAGRNVPWWAAAFSIVATETSTLTFIGLPGIAFGGDLTFLQVAMGYVAGRFFVALVLVPGYFDGRFNTAYEVLAHRFGGSARTTASLIFVVNRVLADGVRLFATALVLVALLPLGLPEGLRLPVSIGLVIGVTLYYTLRGGLRAVIWNDVVQQIVYVGGAALSAAILLTRIPGGWAAASADLAAADKLTWFNPALDFSIPYTFLGGLVGGAVLTSATHGTDQMFVQRLLATGSRQGARKAVIASGVLVFAQIALFLWIGTLLFAFYEASPPAQPFAANDTVFPRFIAEELPVGLGGLVIAAVFAAAMSTLSSSLSALASASTLDLWRRGASLPDTDAHGRHAGGAGDGGGGAGDGGGGAGDDGGGAGDGGGRAGDSEGRERDGAVGAEDEAGEQVADDTTMQAALRLSRRFTVVWAVALAAVAFLAQAWGSVLEAGLTITSITFGAVLGIFLVGQTRWRLSANQASMAMVAGIVALVVVQLLGNLAWTWYTLLGALVTIGCAAVLSQFGRQDRSAPHTN